MHPAIELGTGVVEIEAIRATLVAAVGADHNRSFALDAGMRVSIHAAERGARTYVSAASIHGRELTKGSIVETVLGTERPIQLHDLPRSLTPRILRFIPIGEPVLQGRFTVHRASDRVGIRLNEPRSSHKIELASEPANPGTIQWTPSGQLIVFGPDGPTIGGYPKLGVIIRADIPRLGQLRPYDRVEFEAVTKEEALEITRIETERIEGHVAMLRLLSRRFQAS